jgi:glycosyltransferase involved in cell wall biosynthesis
LHHRVALVHDWLEAPGGGEHVLSALLEIFPAAPVFTLVDFLTPNERQRLGHATIRTSPLQHLPGARSWFRYAAALVPSLIERLDVSGYDVVVSVSHAISKGVRKRAGQTHICFCHTPARFAWTMPDTYRDRIASAPGWRSRLAERAQARFRAWDLAASRHVDHFVANSKHIAGEIRRCYGRDAHVIYPPVDVERFAREASGDRRDYVTVARFVPYKRVDLVIEAFRRLPTRSLTIVGDGPERARLARNLPPNVVLAGRLDDEATARAVGRARAFVFAACEDFGIAPIEAQAAGTPVIAYSRGGVGETIRGLDDPRPTGVLFDEQSADAIVDAILRFEAATIASDDCRRNAGRFAGRRFRDECAAHFAAILPAG